MEFSSGFSWNPMFQEIIRRGSSSSTSSLVLDGERGELVQAMVRPSHKGVKAEKALEALRNHSEAERRRRERINGHLTTLRNLIPGTNKMEKASLLAEVVNHLKELRRNATEATDGMLVPTDIDEVKVEQQEDGSDGASCAIRASLCCDHKYEILSDLRQALDALHLQTVRAEIATFGGRMIYVFIISCCKEKKMEDIEECRLLASSIRHTMRSVLDKFYASEEISSRNTLSNKRRRVPFFESSISSSIGDLW
ncbi:transcription factor AIG1-like [Rhododendron vialii]|uniref:transcription factor AIG1-like n=1 Tax=Rhododendron vialii TaxID=182163 RepID=UPI00265FC180|nr:transcription factor AIG1-like [Rhododendron vialii]XP_058219597.1 transcription factor AIG1-like [Rhododendron vialii]XP_058219598.1 transcription factor AIG1-like [Rhododendron vialii]